MVTQREIDAYKAGMASYEWGQPFDRGREPHYTYKYETRAYRQGYLYAEAVAQGRVARPAEVK